MKIGVKIIFWICHEATFFPEIRSCTITGKSQGKAGLSLNKGKIIHTKCAKLRKNVAYQPYLFKYV